jgi:hypothetical protein
MYLHQRHRLNHPAWQGFFGETATTVSPEPRQKSTPDTVPQHLRCTQAAARIDVAKAVRSNRIEADRRGWGAHREKVERLLGYVSRKPDDELFARSVAFWQCMRGLQPADGIIGKRTWRLMQAPLANIPATPVDTRPPVPQPERDPNDPLNPAYNTFEEFTKGAVGPWTDEGLRAAWENAHSLGPPPIVDYDGSEVLRTALGWTGSHKPGRSIHSLPGVTELTDFEQGVARFYGKELITAFLDDHGVVGYWIGHRGGPQFGGNVVSRRGEILWTVAPIPEYRVGPSFFSMLPIPIPLGKVGKLLGWAGRGGLRAAALLGKRGAAVLRTIAAGIRGIVSQAGWRHINPATLTAAERALVKAVIDAPRVLVGRGINIEGRGFFTLDNWVGLGKAKWTQRLQDVYNYALYLRTRSGQPVHVLAGRKFTAGEAVAAEAGAAVSRIPNIPFWPD